MSLVDTRPLVALSPVDMREVVGVVRSGLRAGPGPGRSWSAEIYDLLAEWCDQVIDHLDAGEAAGPLPAPAPHPQPPSPAPTPAPAPRKPGSQPGRAPTRPQRASRPGQLYCPAHPVPAGEKGAWLVEAAFRRRADRPGKRQAWCRDCTNAYAKAKYLSATTMAALAAAGVLVSSLPSGSVLLERPCPRCDQPWNGPDRIVAGGVTVYHRECLMTDEMGAQ